MSKRSTYAENLQKQGININHTTDNFVSDTGFSGLMIDIARHYLSRSAIEQANRLTLNSVLASYDTVLKDVYGLFAISQDRSLSDRRRSELLKEQFIANMQNIILVSPVTEDIRISPVLWSNYANPEVIEREF